MNAKTKKKKRNSSTYKPMKKNFRHSHHHSELCSFHAQPSLTARLRCDRRRHAVTRTIERASFPRLASLFASAAAASRRRSVTVGSQARGNTAPCLGTGDHLRDGATGHGNSVVSLTGVGVVHGGGRRCAGGLMLRRLRRYPEGGEERSWHHTRGGARRRRALLAYEQARGREPEELGSLEPRPIVARQVRGLRGNLHRHRDAG